jgi:alkanesulfonate monooxygenase SsuD/methylene tetrahydromethanopterin reductase-like flavin-dependent oxidoreductase (luciferase family)
MAAGRFMIYVTPNAVQRPNPPIYVGGALKASSRRAARLGDGFSPVGMTPKIYTAYIDACQELGESARRDVGRQLSDRRLYCRRS